VASNQRNLKPNKNRCRLVTDIGHDQLAHSVARSYAEHEGRIETGLTIMRRIFACLFLLVAPLLAQSHMGPGEPAAGATGPAFEAGVGYVYLSMPTPSQRIGLAGLDANGLVRFATRWGVTVDSTYAVTSNVLGTGHSGNMLSCLAGPVFYPFGHGQAGIFVHALAGASWVDSAVPVSSTNYLGGWVARPSYAAGGGFEHYLFRPIAVRVQADYQRTTFVDSTGAMQGQNDLRLTSSIVYRFGNR